MKNQKHTKQIQLSTYNRISKNTDNIDKEGAL